MLLPAHARTKKIIDCTLIGISAAAFLLMLSPSEVPNPVAFCLWVCAVVCLIGDFTLIAKTSYRLDVLAITRFVVLLLVLTILPSGLARPLFPYVEAFWNFARLRLPGPAVGAFSAKPIILYSKEWGRSMGGNFCVTTLLYAPDFGDEEAALFLWRKYFSQAPADDQHNLAIARPTAIKVGPHHFSYVGCG